MTLGAKARHQRWDKACERAERTPGIKAIARTVAVLKTAGAPERISTHSHTVPRSEASATPSKQPSRNWAMGDDVKPHVHWETPRGRYDVVQKQFSLSKKPMLSNPGGIRSAQKVVSYTRGATRVLTWNLHTTQSNYFAPTKQ